MEMADFLLPAGGGAPDYSGPSFIFNARVFMARFGYFNVAKPWTSVHWAASLQIRVSRILKNTLVLAGATAILSMVLLPRCLRRHPDSFCRRAALDFASWLPSTLPGIILGLGLLSVFLGNPLLRPFYGSMSLLVLATLISSMTLGVQIIKSALTQLGLELEEAAIVSEVRVGTAFEILFCPLSLRLCYLLDSEFYRVGAKCKHRGSYCHQSHQTLVIAPIDFLVDSRYESAAVIGIIVVVLTTGVALISRLLGLRSGIER